MPVTPLTKPPLDANQTEQRCTELLNEWLKSYFDGGAHTVGDFEDVIFPACVLAFNQAAPPTADAPLIHVVYLALRPARDFVNVGGEDRKQLSVSAMLNFLVRVQNAGQEIIGAEVECRRIADLLKMILEHPEARGPLMQKGINHARVMAGPIPQPFTGMQVRLLTVSAQLRYRI